MFNTFLCRITAAKWMPMCSLVLVGRKMDICSPVLTGIRDESSARQMDRSLVLTAWPV